MNEFFYKCKKAMKEGGLPLLFKRFFIKYFSPKDYIRQRRAAFLCLIKGPVPLSQFFFCSSPATLFGHPFSFSDGNLLETLELIYEVIVCNQYHIELIKKNGAVVDAGANIGVLSIYAAVKHPDATIYAFEPTQSTFDILKENTKYYPNIKIFNWGLGDKEEQKSIIIGAHCGMNRIGEGGLPVDIKTIDGLNIPMDFLKMDTEGYEANILKGAAGTIKKYRPIIAMSAYHKPDDKTELPKLLNGIAPYDCELRHDAEDDLICKPQ